MGLRTADDEVRCGRKGDKGPASRADCLCPPARVTLTLMILMPPNRLHLNDDPATLGTGAKRIRIESATGTDSPFVHRNMLYR